MALANSDEVAYTRPATDLDFWLRNADFQFGIVNDSTGVDVLWANGTLSEGILATVLDKIAIVTNTFGAVVVMPTGANSPEYRGVIVRVYTRQLDGAGTTTTCFLIRLLSSGQLLEATSVEAVSG
jgi:hypothetical protein